MQSHKVISIAGWYGAQNVGDEAVLAGILGQLDRYLDQPSFAVFSGDPADTERRYPVKSLYSLPDSWGELFTGAAAWKVRHVMWPGLRQLSRSDAVLIGGGGIIADHQPGQLDGALWRIRLALKRSPVVVTYGVGIEPMQSAEAGARLAKTLNRLPMVAVRDQDSVDELAKWGVKDNVLLAADPALTIQAKPDELPRDKRERLAGSIVICPVHRFAGERLDQYGELHRDALVRLQASLQTPLPVVLAPMFPADECLHPYLESVPGYVGMESLYDVSPAGVVEAFSHVALLLSTRLHGAILGVAAGARVVPVIYDIKVKSFAELAGLGSLAAEFGDGLVWTDTRSSASALANRLRQALETSPMEAGRLAELRLRADLQVQRLIRLLS